MVCKTEINLGKMVAVKVSNQFKSKYLYQVVMHSTWRER